MIYRISCAGTESSGSNQGHATFNVPHSWAVVGCHLRRKVFEFAVSHEPHKLGSEQESGRMGILRGFLKTRIFVFGIGPAKTLARNGHNCWVRCGNDAPWDLRRNFYAELSLVPRRLETRTKRGFPHACSDYGDGTCSDGKANPAKIAGRVGFLHRTDNPRERVQVPDRQPYGTA
jgi:hypothetical protein